MSMPEAAARELSFAQAVREALAEEMRRDSRVCILGEDVAEAGTPFKVLSGLVEEFGTERVIDTPISEAGFTGVAVGATMTGLRPIVDIMFGDFITLTMDQMVNQAAKVHRSEEHTSELQSPCNLVCRLLLEKKKNGTRVTAIHAVRLAVIARIEVSLEAVSLTVRHTDACIDAALSAPPVRRVGSDITSATLG